MMHSTVVCEPYTLCTFYTLCVVSIYSIYSIFTFIRTKSLPSPGYLYLLHYMLLHYKKCASMCVAMLVRPKPGPHLKLTYASYAVWNDSQEAKPEPINVFI